MKAAAGIAGIVVLVAAIVYLFVNLIQFDNRREAKNQAADRANFARINTICGRPPLAIKTHGASWNYGPWIEVTCADGTKRAIR